MGVIRHKSHVARDTNEYKIPRLLARPSFFCTLHTTHRQSFILPSANMLVKLGAAALCFLAAVNAAPKEDIVELEKVENNLVARHSDDTGLQQYTAWRISNIYIGCGVASVGCSYQFDIDSDESVAVPGIHVQCYANRLPVPLDQAAWRPCYVKQVVDTSQGSTVYGFYAAVTLNPRQNTGSIALGMSFGGYDQSGRFRNHFFRGVQGASYKYLSESASPFYIYPYE
ncbi:hypothetical protein AC578_4380 [Pseudocercospora eumusae]|uniref:Uncharacterized protein n=1 Tax=Pseudocercospora eumusae TaxID=321146 RepID=A0A139H659_9PEZI|nr:hypothetical protein AC578_4380 [Pseudocercospora eumusae]